MIKYLNRLKNKRGFTLVELIVVIAIIGVLAAILTPIMMGVVVKARVTSANTTASRIGRAANMLLVQWGSMGYGGVGRATVLFNITVKRTGKQTVWSCSSPDTSGLSSSGDVKWGTTGTFTTGDDPDKITSGEALICAALCDAFGTMSKASMVIVVSGGKVTFVAYTEATNDVLPTSEYPQPVDGTPPAGFAWNGTTEGISPSGMAIGTYPQIPLVKK